MSTIHTKWHKMKACIDDDNVYWTAVPGEKCDPFEKHASIPVTKLNSFFAAFEELPKFVVDLELMSLVSDENYHLSLMDMKRAGVMRLPFPACLVEFDLKGVHTFVLLRDLQAGGILPFEDRNILVMQDDAAFYALCWGLLNDEHGEYLVLSPSLLQLDINEAPPGADDPFYLKIGGSSNALTKENAAVNQLVGLTHRKDAAWAYRALFAMLLLVNTKGVKKEIIECERLNRKRVASDKPPIPRHTYITIGKVYRSAASEQADEYVPRRSPRPHWRRGHLRNIRIGKGRTGTKPTFIEGKLVSLAHDAEVAAPTYIVKP